MASINESTMRQSIYKALYTTLNANKPTGWTIKSKMPQISSINSSLPLIVFQTSINLTDLPTLDKSTVADYTASASFMFIAKDSNKASEDLDVAVDTIRAQLKANQSTWETNGFYVDEITEEFADMEIQGGNRLITGALSCQIKIIT